MKSRAWCVVKGAWQSLCGTGVSPVRGGKGFPKSGERAGRPFHKVVVRALTLAVAVGFGSVRAEIPASAYVQDGLIAQWDGIENAGRSAGKVVDLVGGYEIVLGSGESAASDSFFLNAQHSVNGAFAAKSSTNPLHMTIEVRGKPSAMTGGSEMPVVEAAGRNAISFDKRQGMAGMSLYCKQSESSGSVNRYYYSITSHPLKTWDAICASGAKPFSYAVAFGCSTAAPRAYIDGSAASVPDSPFWNGNSLASADEIKVGNSQAPTTYNAVRIYNRELSEDEILFNAAIDRIRFEGTDPAEVLPEGTKYENGTFYARFAVACLDGCGTVSVNGSAVDPISVGWAEFGSARTLVATPAAGQVFVRWDGEGLTDAERANATLSLACTRSWDLVAVFRPTGALPTENRLHARSYVTDGLIHQWDGRENVGYGQAQDKTAKTWVDLASGQLNIPVPTKDAVFTDDGLQVSRDTSSGTGASGWTTSKAWGAFTNRTFTVEAAYNQTAAMSGGNPAGYPEVGAFLGLGDEPYWFGVNLNNRVGMNGCVKGTSNGSLSHYQSVETTLGQHTLSCSQDDATEKIGFDGTYVTVSVSAERGTPKTGRGFTFAKAGYWSPKNTIDGVFLSMRFYDHPLSDADRQVNLAVDKVRFFGGDASEQPLTGGYVFDYSDGIRLMSRSSASVQPDGAGSVSVDDGTPSDVIWFWGEKAGYVTKKLEATPADGYEFAGWVGDFRNEVDRESTVVTAQVQGDVVAFFRKAGVRKAQTYTWVGGSDADWNDSSSWRNQDDVIGVPVAGDSVVIPAGKTAVLANETPEYDGMTVGGTLKFSGWATKLNVTNLIVNAGGVLSPLATFTEDAESNRVNIACVDLTVERGGKIDANRLGYRSGPANRDNTTGLGPGKGAPNGGGGGHGGRGGRGYSYWNILSPTYGLVCDSCEEPVQPGSSGGSGDGGDNPGGGAIRIAATGDVRVRGSVTADGKVGDNYQGGGAGGSVYITCRTFDGDGLVTANGGFVNVSGRGAGGGGRISIRWTDKAAQAALRPTATISASARAWGHAVTIPDDANHMLNTAWMQRGEYGTVYLTDDSFYAAGGWTNCYGSVSFEQAASELTVDDDVAFAAEPSANTGKSGQEVVFTGRTVRIDGTVTLGANAHLTFVDCDVTADSFSVVGGHLHLMGHTKLVVNGDVTVGGAGQVTVESGATNGVGAATWSEYGAYVEVKGTLALNDTAKLNVWSESVNGGSAFFKFGNLSVAAGAVVNGNTLGWGQMGADTARWPLYCRGFGPGTSIHCAGAGYGGEGGASNYYGDRGRAYGNAKDPTDPGSSAGKHSANYYTGGYGGGLFRAVIGGTLTLDGAITMNGGIHPYDQGGSGSGGGVNLVCRTLAGAGTICANGGAAKNNAYSGDGGGGRIAIQFYDKSAFTGTIEAKGGGGPAASLTPAKDGSIYLKDLSRQLREWTGLGGDGLWSNPDNWEPTGVPVSGDEIMFGSGSITLSGETPNLRSIEVGGTVNFSGWETKLNVSNMVVKPTGLVRPSAAFTEDAESNRVFIACVDLTVEKDGQINANELGYRIGPNKGDGTTGLGPGKGAPNGGGGGHGGCGGMGWNTGYKDSATYGIVCDSREEPVQPGSSGGAGSNNQTATGGGAIRIAATGDVRVWGSVTANGTNGGGQPGGGAGGSVFISCRTFDGDGLVTANGGFNNSSGRGAGGGGRISIRWTDGEAQAALHPTPTISASTRGWGFNSYVPDNVNRGVQNEFNQRGENGTVYLTDDSFYAAGGWSNCYGNVSFETSTGALTAGDLAFAAESGVNWSKSGQEIVIADRTVALGRITSLGKYAHLTFVDCDVTAESIAFSDGHLHFKGHTKLVVTGDVTVGGAGQFTVQAGETNGVDAATWNEYGAYVEVKGNLTLNDTARLNVWSHDVNGGSPFFKLKNVMVAVGAKIYGNTLGWGRMSSNTTLWPTGCRGYGPGASVQGAAASYGGRGGKGSVGTVGAVYGDRKEPMDPGSSAGKHSAAAYVGGYGGGLFRAVIDGTLTLDGAITMNGGAPASNSEGGAGSGGGVNIRCGRLAGAGSITANGGNGASKKDYSGDGGGGRIAVRVLVSDEGFTGTLTATNGCSGVAYATPAHPGTVYYKVHRGLMMLVR